MNQNNELIEVPVVRQAPPKGMLLHRGGETVNRDEVDGVPTPSEFKEDYGVPHGICSESAAHPGVFTREWSKASVQLDCNSFKGLIEQK